MPEFEAAQATEIDISFSSEVTSEGDNIETTLTSEDMEPPLIGQAEASEAIRTGVERAFTVGLPTLVVVQGAAGSGRTRMLTYAGEIAARVAPNVRILYAACRKDGGDGPYAPFSRLLLDRFGVTPSSSPSAVRGQMSTTVSEALGTKDAIVVAETVHLLGHVAGVPFPDSPFLAPLRGKPTELRSRVTTAMRRLVEGDAQTRPVLVLLDDMHFAEEDGWALLSGITNVAGHVSVVVAGDAPIADRAEQLDPAGGVAIGPLAPLNEDDVAAMLHVLLPTLISVPEELAGGLLHRSKGNPGAVRELTFALLESGLFQPAEDGLEVDLARLEQGELPITLDDAIESRLTRLNEFEQATLERASVVGEVFWDGAVLAQMRAERGVPGDAADPMSIWPDDEDLAALETALDGLVERGFITNTASEDLPGAREMRFLVQGARTKLYERLGAECIVQRHTAVARWLAVSAEVRREGIAGLIAPHLEKAGMGRRAGRAYLEAAGYERSQMHTNTALRLIEKALPLLDSADVVRKIDALHEHGSLLSTVGLYDDAIRAFTEMLRLAWSIGARGKGGAALNRLGRVRRQRGDNEAARALLDRALSMFRTAGDLRGVASTLDDLAQVHRLGSENDRAIRAATEALEIRRQHGDRRGEAVSLTTLGGIELDRGKLDIAGQVFEQALEIRKAIGDREGESQTYNALGIVAYERGDIKAAIASWKEALSAAEEMADARAQCFLLNNLGEAYLELGDIAEAKVALEEARDHAEMLGDKRGMAEVGRNLGRAAMRDNDDNAEESLAEALQMAKDYGSRDAIALVYRAFGVFRAQTLFDADGGVDKRAEEAFLASIDLFRDIGSEKEASRSLAELGYHLIERGDIETAKERLHEARAIMRQIGLRELERVERTLEEIA
ncbi:MAG: tetratricopeptide repeat protein [Deltaproteobacteria bacterium]|nr:tetratricopeptide repeat protein [Deltaproteobacteria bacterium]